VPELTNRLQHLGEYLRYNTSYPPRLSEFAIIVTARHFNSQYEWHAHAPLAVKGGLAPAIVDAVREKRRPQNMQPDEADVYDFVSELLANNKVSEAAYQRVVDRFKLAGAVELAGLVGYYIMIAMTLLAHEVPLPEGQAPYWKG
jgi:4-carboxymuconolactone decarboxylase